jgi:hypothetical protein
VAAHLEKLVEDGLVVAAGSGFEPR